MDPLTDDYPALTPYQYAGDEPIGNVDMDGLEPCPVNVVGTGSKAISNFPSRALIMAVSRIAANQINNNLQFNANANQAL